MTGNNAGFDLDYRKPLPDHARVHTGVINAG